MSADLFRQVVEAWNARDVERVVEMTHPDVDFRSRLTDVEGAAYHGHDGLRRYFADLADTFADMEGEVHEIEEHGDWVVATLRFSGTGSASRATLEWEVILAARTRDGLFVQMLSESTKEAALAAAGLE